MGNKRKLILFVLLLNMKNYSTEFRDPFKPVKKNSKNEFVLNAILISENINYASISFQDRNYVVTVGDIIEGNYSVKNICSNTLTLINLETDFEKNILLPN